MTVGLNPVICAAQSEESVSRFGLPLAAVLVVGFYIGIQFGLPFWEGPFFHEGRTYQLIPVGEAAPCPSGYSLNCSGEMVFDSGGRVLLIEVGQGQTGTYRLKDGELRLVFPQPQGEVWVTLEVSPDRSRLTNKESGRQWSLKVSSDQSDS